MEPSTTLFASVPNLGDLCHFRCIVSNLQMTHEITKEIRHCQIFCCRDIIRTFSRTLAAPVPRSDHYFYVIVPKKYYETNQLQEFFNSKLIHFSKPQEVTFEIYKICAKYSIIYKLLPVWNRVGDYLCKGQSYSELTDELDAIKLDVDIKEEGMFLRFNPLRLKLYPLSLEAIGVAEPTLVKFQTNPKVPIHFRRQTAYILPNLEMCKLFKITKEIPDTCNFQHYHVIRDHWKNMYGIVLPRKKDGINFCEFVLQGFEDRTFVYPEICLQAELPKIIECNNQTEISNQFLEALKINIPKICGEELSFVYHDDKPTKIFLKPKEMPSTRLINDTPPPSLNTLNVFTYEPKAPGSFSFKMNFNSQTQSFDRNSVSKLQNRRNNSIKLNDSTISSKKEFVSNWLLNSCLSPGSSQETESQTNCDTSEEQKDLLLKKRMKFSNSKKPIIRSIERAKISLSPFKRAIMNTKNTQPSK